MLRTEDKQSIARNLAFLESSVSESGGSASGSCLRPAGPSDCLPHLSVCRPEDTAAGGASSGVSNFPGRFLGFPLGGSHARGLEAWKGRVSGCLRAWLIGTRRLTAGFFLLFAALFATAAQADTLVSNTGQPTHDHARVNVGSSGVNHFSVAQRFTTGGNEHGYTLSEVVAVMRSVPQGMSPRVSIYTNDSGKPGSSLYVLSNPGRFTTGNTTFTAPPDATLEKETGYFVVFEERSRGYTLNGTGTNDEDSGGAIGWRISNGRLTRNSDSSKWQANTVFEVKIGIKGTVNTLNNPATGALTISGTAQVGQPLTASTSGISDDDGLTGVVYSYQWTRVDADGSSNPTDIGADSDTYTLVADDVGRKARVKVNFTDDAGNDEEVTSDAYPMSGTVVALPVNSPPVFTDGENTTRSINETVGDATTQTADDIGDPVTATDSDSDTLTYTLEGTDAAKFTIISTTGQIKTKAGERYDYETKASYSVKVKVDDSRSGTDTITVIINVVDVDDTWLVRNTEQVQDSTPQAAVPGAPADLTAVGGDSEVTLIWNDPDEGASGIIHYEYKVDNGPWISTGGKSTSYTVTGIDNGETYTFRVRAVNATGPGAESEPVTATPAATVPGPPLNLSLAPGDGHMMLRWEPPADDGGLPVTGYQYSQKEEGGSFGELILMENSASGEKNDASYAVTGLKNGTLYSFRMCAENAAGPGDLSAEATAEVNPPAFQRAVRASLSTLPALGGPRLGIVLGR